MSINNKVSNTTTTTTNTDNNWEYCSFRLPCGVCTRTNAMCPLNNNWKITWAGDMYCGSGSASCGDVE